MLSTIVQKARLDCSPCKGEMPSASEAERVLKGAKQKSSRACPLAQHDRHIIKQLKKLSLLYLENPV